jgi:hypothetical protein
MKFKKIFLLLLIAYSPKISAQTKIDTIAIIAQLQSIHERDQKTRTKGDSTGFIHFIDSCNLAQVEKLIDRYGWLGKNVVGTKGNQTLFLVIQHADLKTQKKYLLYLQKSVNQEESNAADLALLQDRMLMRQHMKQIYGSQVIYNDQGRPEFYPIEDEKNVNLRRQNVGLEPIEDYAGYFGIEYKLP